MISHETVIFLSNVKLPEGNTTYKTCNRRNIVENLYAEIWLSTLIDQLMGSTMRILGSFAHH